MTNKVLRTHVLFESSSGGVPHGCSVIRLLRPLSHPSVQTDLTLTYDLNLPSQAIDILILERFWDYTCNWQRHLPILKKLRNQNTRIIFEIDDDLFNVNSEVGDECWPSVAQKMWLRQVVRFADGVIVSTPQLANRLSRLNSNIAIIENALDERLFEKSHDLKLYESKDFVVFGYMGTFTHLDDLISIIKPLREILARYRDRVRFEIVGVSENEIVKTLFYGLPVKFHNVPPHAVLYEEFTRWMQENIHWDFAIAPLIDTQFTRSKSDIKFLDYGVQGIPGIFSDVPAYNTTVKHTFNGILASGSDEWVIWLEKMILDCKLREKLATRAHEEIWSERMLKTKAANWITVLKKFAGQE